MLPMMHTGDSVKAQEKQDFVGLPEGVREGQNMFPCYMYGEEGACGAACTIA